jgi:hypothetical protein
MVDTAHVHFFKHLISELKRRGDEVLVTARKKDITLELLEKLGIEYRCISSRGSGLPGLAWELVVRNVRMFGVARGFRPDVMLAKNAGPAIGLTGALLRVPRIVFEDTEHARLQRMAGLPFATWIVTGDGYLGSHGRRQRTYRGIWVQAYLDERYFTPDAELVRRYGVEPKEYIVLRTVAWEAAHDAGHKGIGEAGLREAVERLGRFGRVVICSERPLPEVLKEYANPVPHEHVHHLLAFARLYIGEGGSMSSEAAVLGTPAIFCNPLRHGCGCLLSLEKEYGLLHSTDTLAAGVEVADAWLSNPNLQERWDEKLKAFRERCDNLPEYMLRLVDEAAGKGGGR